MRDFTKGMLARSKAGHDTGKWYVVMDVDQEYVYLADGEARTLDRLKKRNANMFRFAIRFQNLWIKF